MSTTAQSLSRIEKLDAQLHAFLHVNRNAKTAQSGPLAGMPIGIKDLIHVEGMPTTAGSKILKGFVPPFSATVVERLVAAGAVIVGKLNLDEFGMGSSTENSAFGPTRNPYALDRTAGGSSGGSAAAVAAGMCDAALGTDTGGSIRLPASFCNLAALRPTYGRVSRWGVVSFASSLDQVGPMARSLQTCEALFQCIAGADARDMTCAQNKVAPPLEKIVLKGKRIGLPTEYFGAGLTPEVEKLVRDAAHAYEKLGCELVEVSLPHTRYALSAYYLLAPSEASSNLARYDGVRFGHRASDVKNLNDMYERSRAEGFGPEVKRRIMLGTFALSAGYYDAYYLKAQKVRTLVRRDFESVFEKVDVVLSPVCPVPAFKLGEVTSPMDLYKMDVLTIPSALAGIPALSVPAGFTSDGLPVGMQLMGRPFQESELFAFGRAYEADYPWFQREPAL